MGGDVLQHHHKTRLGARLVQSIAHAVEQGVEVFAGLGGKDELLSRHVQNVLLALRRSQVGIQEVLAQLGRGVLQISHAKCADRLNDIGFDRT